MFLGNWDAALGEKGSDKGIDAASKIDYSVAPLYGPSNNMASTINQIILTEVAEMI